MKIFRIFLIIYLVFSGNIFAQEIVSDAKKNQHHKYNNNKNYNHPMCPLCADYLSPNFLPKNNVITANGVSVTVVTNQGMNYINGRPIGTTLTTGFREGIFYINDRPIKSYLEENSEVKNDQSEFYLQAFTKFSFGDFKGALVDCGEALKINPKHGSCVVLRTLAQAVIDGKISEEEAKKYDAQKILQIVQSEKLLGN